MTITLPNIGKLVIAGIAALLLLLIILMISSDSGQLSLPGFDTAGQTQQQDPCSGLPQLKQAELHRLKRVLQEHQTASTNWFIADMRSVLSIYGLDRGSVTDIVELVEIILTCQS